MTPETRSPIEPVISRQSTAYRAGHFIGRMLGKKSERVSGPVVVDEVEPLGLSPLATSSAEANESEVLEETPKLEDITYENSQELLDGIGAKLDHEIVDLEEQIAELAQKDDRHWNLRRRVGEREGGHTDFRAIDKHQERLGRAISKKYGAPGDLYRQLEKLKRTLHKRRTQKDYLRVGNILEFEEDVDPKLFRRFLPNPDEDLGENFHLPKNPNPTTNPAEAQELLRTLPFVENGQIWEPGKMKDVPQLKIRGNWEFPLDRIIGVTTFKDWSGRGNGEGDGKSFEPVNIKDIERTSRGAITDYAHTEDMSWLYDDSPFGNGIDVEIVRDANGEFWGIVSGNGSHSTAAAKLRGERKIPIGTISIRPEAYMPEIYFGVKERFGAEKAKTEVDI